MYSISVASPPTSISPTSSLASPPPPPPPPPPVTYVSSTAPAPPPPPPPTYTSAPGNSIGGGKANFLNVSCSFIVFSCLIEHFLISYSIFY